MLKDHLVSKEGEAVDRVICNYARSWCLLQGYDEQQLAEVSIKAIKLTQVTKASAFNKSMVATGDLKWSHVRSEPEKAYDLKETDLLNCIMPFFSRHKKTRSICA